MKKARRSIFIGVMAIGFALFAWFLLKPREPSYEGKTLTAWLEEAEGKDIFQYPDSDPEAENAIRHIGTNAIPTLLRLVSSRNTAFKKLSSSLNQKLDDIDLSLHLPVRSQTESQSLGAIGFLVLGSEAKSAVPHLITLLKEDDEQVRNIAAWSLAQIGPDARSAVPELLKQLEWEKTDTNEWSYGAVMALGTIEDSSPAVVQALKVVTTNRSLYYHALLQAALIKLHADSFSPILEQLNDTANTNWIYAASVSGALGTNAGAAVPALLKALAETNGAIAHFAISTLGEVHQKPEICVPALVPFINSTNQNDRFFAIFAISRFGRVAKAASPALIQHLNDIDNGIRRVTTNALRSVDPEAAAKAGIK